MLLGFDPGRDKCGIAIVNPTANQIDQTPILHEVAPATQALDRIGQLLAAHSIDRLIIGDQTASKTWQQRIKQAFPDLEIVMVDERNSSLEARDRYWQMYPPTGLMRLTPKGMRQPPRPIDDIVAILLIERYLMQSSQ
jgi:RNase H-fold protein (predicted Holliday junction resolvase)